MKLWSIKERMFYSVENATLKEINGVYIYTTPKGEPLVAAK